MPSSNSGFSGALVGFGQVAEACHVAALQSRKQISIVGVCEADPQRLKLAKRAWPKARGYSDFNKMLSSEPLDFVILCTPPHLHAEQTLLALEKGCHVLCEKPLTLDPSELSKIKASARRNKKTVHTVHNWKHAPLFAALLKKVQEGVFGEIRHVELHALRTAPAAGVNSWRGDARFSGGGILVDHGWHNLYLLDALLGRPGLPRLTSAFLSPGAAEAEASVFFQFPRATAFLRLSWLAPERRNWGIVNGTRGSAELRDSQLIIRGGGAEQTHDFPEKLSAGSAHPEWLKPAVDEFLAAMAAQKPSGENFAEAEFCCSVISEIYSRRGAGAERPLESLPRTHD